MLRAVYPNPPPACSIVVDRHVHKNGGSTLRNFFFENDRRGGWRYYGYGLDSAVAVAHFLKAAILHPNRTSNCSDWSRRPVLRLAAEQHYGGYLTTSALLRSFGPASPLRSAALSCACRVVLVTRFREPFSFYSSFYTWAVARRQASNSSHYGATMLEWAAEARNLQSTLFMELSTMALVPEYIGVRDASKRFKYSPFWAFDPDDVNVKHFGFRPGRVKERGAYMVGAARLAALRQTLASFDLVGVVERFEETLLLLADLSGLRELEFLTAVKPHKRWCGPAGCRNEEDKSNDWPGCPSGTSTEACRAAIREAAPIDHLIYSETLAAFDARVAALGAPFAARVEAVRRLRQARGTRNATGEVKVAGVSQKKKVLKESEIDMSRAGDVCNGLLAGESPASARACRLIEGDTQYRMGWRTSAGDVMQTKWHAVRTQGKPAKGRGGVAAKGPVRGGGPIARGRDYRGRGGRL